MNQLPGKRSAGSESDPRPVALVTGGARRVGRAIVEHLAEHGYRVAVHSNQSAAAADEVVEQLVAAGHAAIAVKADLREPAAIRAMIETTHEHFGCIDALVNSAAVWGRKRLEAIEADDVREQFEVNTLAPFLCCQQVGLLMAEQAGGGAIVNIGDWAIVRPYVDYAAYFPAKGAIPTLTRTLAVELAARNPRVRVNAVLPGPVLLPADLSPDERQEAIDATLVKREGTPAHVADAVLFLLRNDFVTGVCLPVDGGRSVFAGRFGRDQ
jgi:pteridine reductase